jgi:hypothetical protein
MDKVTKIAQSLRKIYVEERSNLKLPFFYSFPKNSCESASIFLALILKTQFHTKAIEIVHGKNIEERENHFWVTVDGYIYDLTVDQFDGISSPIYCEESHPMDNYFTLTSSKPIFLAFQKYSKTVLEIEKSRPILRELQQLIELY